MLTAQQKWNRYVKAINYCTSKGLVIDFEESSSNNVIRLKAKWDYMLYKGYNYKEAIILLKPKKYKPLELFFMIIQQIGFPRQQIKMNNK